MVLNHTFLSYLHTTMLYTSIHYHVIHAALDIQNTKQYRTSHIMPTYPSIYIHISTVNVMHRYSNIIL